jgi:hypothetical protein
MNYTTLTSPPTPPLQGEGSKITPPSLIGKGAGGLGLLFAPRGSRYVEGV